MHRRFMAFTSMRGSRLTWFGLVWKTSASQRRHKGRCQAITRPRPADTHLSPSGRGSGRGRGARQMSQSVWSRVSGRTRKVLAAGLRALSPPLAGGYYEEVGGLLGAPGIGPALAARPAAPGRPPPPPPPL